MFEDIYKNNQLFPLENKSGESSLKGFEKGMKSFYKAASVFFYSFR